MGNKRLLKILLIVGGLIFALFCLFYAYTLDYYRADPQVVDAFSNDEVRIHEQKDHILFYPEPSKDQKIGIIFYPGGKVEPMAYAPLLEQLTHEGMTCLLLPMPMNLAVFHINAADGVYDQYPDIEHWYLIGHSLGGAMASGYDGKHEGKLDGLILLGAYPMERTDTPTISIHGSEDLGLNMDKFEKTDVIIEIVGGNHAYFGNYGEQEGDGTATITREEQQQQTIEAIIGFIHTTKE